MGGLFLSTTPWACENFTNIQNLEFENFEKLKDNLNGDISAFLPHKTSIDEFILLVHKCVKKRINSDIITDDFRVVLTLNNAESTLLNSFYIDDIGKILSSGNINKNLEQIFDENNIENFKRINTRDDENLEILIDKLVGENFTLGAFASKYMLTFSQQIAVNEIMKLFKKQEGGIYSVNGPPGTGKTTLLKDIIAGVLVERALALSKLNENEIFNTGIKLTSESKYPDFYPLNDSLKGFEIVVTSSNNKAVQNISAELPRIDSVDKKYLSDLDYFKTHATGLLSANSKPKFNKQAWGLISASLGKSANINDFKSNCLYSFEIDKDSQEFTQLQNLGLINKFNKHKGLIEYLMYDKHTPNFTQAKEEFLNSLEKVKQLNTKSFERFKELKEKHTLLLKFANINLKDKIIEKSKQLTKLNDDFATLISLNEPRKPDLQKLSLPFSMPIKPGFIDRILKTKAYKEYIAECKKIKHTNELIRSTNEKINKLNQNMLNEFNDKLKNFKEHKEKLQNKINLIKSELNELKQSYQNYKDYQNIKREFNEFMNNFQDRKIREKSSFFMMENNKKTALAEARIELFIKALALHKAMILSNAVKFAKIWKYFTQKS